jgi:hypothetical protein
MPTPVNYSRLFRNLAHIVALSRDVQVTGVVDSLVSTALTLNPNIRARLPGDLVDAVETYFGIKFAEKDLQSSSDRLLRTGRLQRTSSGALVPSPQTQAEISQRVHDAHQLEELVRQEWLESFWKTHPGRDATADNELWACLQSYMARAFERHGAQTTLLLAPSAHLPADIDKTLRTYMREATSATCRTVSQQLAREAIRQFFVETTPARSRYIAQLLDGTFSFFAICVDEVTSAYLKTAIQPVSIFLDTNFVFGLLKLHDNPLNEVSEELVEAIREHQFPFKLYYHERTLREFQNAIYNIRERLLSYAWTQELSRAAIRTRSLSTIELRYHEANAHNPVDARAFLTKYQHVEELLKEKGFTVYREPQKGPAQIDQLEKEQTLLIAKYNRFLVNRLGFDRAKAYRTIEHDMIVWQTVKYLRQRGSSVLDIGALFLTADQNLYAFDWNEMRPEDGTGHVILPNQLLQLLRPFLVVTADFDKKFAATFAIPEFRTLASGYTSAAAKVLGYLTTLADVTEETASRILANEVLLGKLRDVAVDAPEFKKAIDSEVIRDNEKLLRENEKLLESVTDTERRRAGTAAELDQKNRLLDQHERLLREHEALVRAQRDELQQREQQLKLEKAARVQREIEARALEHKIEDVEANRDSSERELKRVQFRYSSLTTRLRIIGAVVVFLCGCAGLAYLARHVPWLINHSHRIGLTLCGFLIIAGLSWAIADHNSGRRNTALIAVVLASIVTLVQVIDSDNTKSGGSSAQSSPTP